MSQTGMDPGEGRDDRHHEGLLSRFRHQDHHDAPDGVDAEHDPTDAAPTRSRPRGSGCLPGLVLLVVLMALLGFGGRWAFEEISSRFGPAPDYSGAGSGRVLFEVEEGASSAQIGRQLKAAGVVKSVDAFTEAATKEEASRNIQVGYYQLKKQMQASAALEVLVDAENLLQSLVVVPEGARVDDVAKTIVDKTDISRKAVAAALADPKAIGLPPEAKGNPEGYLYPATYTVPPKQTAVGLLRQMVEKTVEVESSLDIEAKASELGLDPEQVLTVASIIEYEVNKDEDYPKVARVIYNRLEKDMPLQMDSTVAYISKRKGDVFTTAEERASTSLYNTYRHTGLPPGPIGSPGESTIEAALNPAEGDWLYFVADYEEDTTRFSSTLAEHGKWVQKLREYCQSSEDC